MRRSSEAKQQTRASLLAAAAREFARVGFQRANIDSISLAAGYSKGTIYNYFRSKDELFAAVVEAASREASTRGQSPPDAHTRERIKSCLDGFCWWARDNDDLARVLVRECLMGTPGLYPQVIRAEAPLVGQLEAILKEGMDRGDVRADVPADLLSLAVAGLTDLALVEHWASDGGDPRSEDIPELVLRLLLGSPSPQNDRRGRSTAARVTAEGAAETHPQRKGGGP